MVRVAAAVSPDAEFAINAAGTDQSRFLLSAALQEKADRRPGIAPGSDALSHYRLL
jgi:hypothetical protein